jgi:hypothetical protein
MTDQAIEDEIRKLACMSPRSHPEIAALLRQIDAARRERDTLGAAIRNAALKSGIITGEVSLTGPDLPMLCRDMQDLIDDERAIAAIARRDRDEILAALRNWLDAEKGCGNPACNIGGGLCADCSVLAAERKGEAAGIVAKYKKAVSDEQ